MTLIAIVPATLSRDGQDTGVLTPMGGVPLLDRLLARLSKVDKLAQIVVLTSDADEDAVLSSHCADHGIPCRQAPRDDLMGGLLAALKGAGAKGGVMVEATNPLMDPALVDKVANLLEMTDGMLDWIGNTLSQTYPRGMEIDGFTTAALEEADKRCAEPAQRRAGPAFLRENGRIYRPLSLTAPVEVARPDLNLKLEGPADLLRMEAIFAHFAGRDDFSLEDIISFLDATPN